MKTEAHDTEPAPPPDTEPSHEIPEHPFHKHLAGCKQCREQPFNLCRVGEPLLNPASWLL